MATRAPGDKRGPKIGDAASLWNFTPSPGWTKEEAHILKLCLMKLGVGRWVQILDTGLLPGKLIQQLNGQTQRLLGQQSLAAYTGLQVDIDRIRADNETRTDAPRKAGLIINTGPNLTKEMKEKMQEEARAKYGLTAEQIREAEEQLEEIAAAAAASAGASAEEAALLAADPTTLSRDDRLALLRLLHTRLGKMHGAVADHQKAAAARPAQQAQQAKDKAEQPEGNVSDQENGAGNAKPGQRDGAGGAAPASAPAKQRRASGGGRGRKRATPGDTESDEEMAEAAEAAAAAKAVTDADVATLVSMGFGERQAKDALEEADGSVELAAEWLMTHCV